MKNKRASGIRFVILMFILLVVVGILVCLFLNPNTNKGKADTTGLELTEDKDKDTEEIETPSEIIIEQDDSSQSEQVVSSDLETEEQENSDVPEDKIFPESEEQAVIMVENEGDIEIIVPEGMESDGF